jgi:hypothetical protein
VRYPSIEPLAVQFYAGFVNAETRATLFVRLYVVPRGQIVLPLHRCFLRVEVDGLTAFENLAIVSFGPAKTVTGGRNRGTGTEVVIVEPGAFEIAARAPLTSAPTGYGDEAVATLHLEAADARRPLVLSLALQREKDPTRCSFVLPR